MGRDSDSFGSLGSAARFFFFSFAALPAIGPGPVQVGMRFEFERQMMGRGTPMQIEIPIWNPNTGTRGLSRWNTNGGRMSTISTRSVEPRNSGVDRSAASTERLAYSECATASLASVLIS